MKSNIIKLKGLQTWDFDSKQIRSMEAIYGEWFDNR